MQPKEALIMLRKMPGVQAMYEESRNWLARDNLIRMVVVFLRGGFFCANNCWLRRKLPATGRARASCPLHLFSNGHAIDNSLFGCWRPGHPALWAAIMEACRRIYQILDTGAQRLNDEQAAWATGGPALESANKPIRPWNRVVVHRASGTYRLGPVDH